MKGILVRLFRCFPAAVGVLFLLVYILTYSFGLFGQPIRSDGAGYYMYLPSLVLHGDPGFDEVAAHIYGGDIPAWTGVERYAETGRYFNRFNIGVALLMFPFFLVAHLLTLLSQVVPGLRGWATADGYTFFYQHAAGLSGLFYMWAGLVLLRKQLALVFSEAICAATLACLVFGTNLFNYGSGESVLSHAYSFFLFVALLRVVPGWLENPASWRRAVLVGVTVGLILLVRLNNVVVCLLIPLYGVVSARDVSGRVALFLRHLPQLALMGGVAVAVFIPQLMLWHHATGKWFVYSYGKYGFDFLHPNLAGVFFSFERGLFFWFPVLIFAVAGFIPLRERLRAMFWPCLVYMLFHVYLVASWCQWGFGGGFGNRAFVESYALLAYPLAAFLENRAAGRRPGAWGVVSACFMAWTLLLMDLYYLREISFYGLDAQAIYDILWTIREALRGCLLP